MGMTASAAGAAIVPVLTNVAGSIGNSQSFQAHEGKIHRVDPKFVS
jgi:hypothetical protein